MKSKKMTKKKNKRKRKTEKWKEDKRERGGGKGGRRRRSRVRTGNKKTTERERRGRREGGGELKTVRAAGASQRLKTLRLMIKNSVKYRNLFEIQVSVLLWQSVSRWRSSSCSLWCKNHSSRKRSHKLRLFSPLQRVSAASLKTKPPSLHADLRLQLYVRNDVWGATESCLMHNLRRRGVRQRAGINTLHLNPTWEQSLKNMKQAQMFKYKLHHWRENWLSEIKLLPDGRLTEADWRRFNL